MSYDLRNLLYDKLQHMSFAFHDSEHTGNLMSKATADIEQVRRFVNLGLVRSGCRDSTRCGHEYLMVLELETGPAQSRLRAVYGPWSTLVLRKLRPMWLHVRKSWGKP